MIAPVSIFKTSCIPYAARSTEGQVRDRDKIIFTLEMDTYVSSRCNVRARHVCTVIDVALNIAGRRSISHYLSGNKWPRYFVKKERKFPY